MIENFIELHSKSIEKYEAKFIKIIPFLKLDIFTIIYIKLCQYVCDLTKESRKMRRKILRQKFPRQFYDIRFT